MTRGRTRKGGSWFDRVFENKISVVATQTEKNERKGEGLPT